MSDNIITRNNNNQLIGYFQYHWPDGKIFHKSFFKNGVMVCYGEWHNNNDELSLKKYYIR